MELTREIARKVLQTVDAGLVKGLGNPVPGQMCIEAAVCYALGMPHGDDPKCIGRAVRSYKIRLNDSRWSSDAARAKGMRRVAIAQLGSDQIDQNEFCKEVALQGVRQILPIALRAVAKMIPDHAATLEASAIACEAVGEFAQAQSVAAAANKAARNAAAYAAADEAAYAAAAAAADAAAAAYADAARDDVLAKAAEIGVQALIKLGSKGCEWLDLCD